TEQNTVPLVDMKNSTGMAELRGPVRFHELLNDFFRDVADAALECEAEIHKYVGDEAILTWPSDRGLSEGDVLACPFIALGYIAANRSRYSERFGIAPEFRAALHCGEIVAGEIGDVRREIAYVGDTLNAAARLPEPAKTGKRDGRAAAGGRALGRRARRRAATAAPSGCRRWPYAAARPRWESLPSAASSHAL